MNPKMKCNRTLILVVGLCAILGSADFAHGKPKIDPNEGDRGNGNTSEGLNALGSLTIGANNTADGSQALFNLNTGSNNTATGARALLSLTGATDNTAMGSDALL